MWALLLCLPSKVFSTPVFLSNHFVNSNTIPYWHRLSSIWQLISSPLKSFPYMVSKTPNSADFSPSLAVSCRSSVLIPSYLPNYIILTSPELSFWTSISIYFYFFLEILPGLIVSHVISIWWLPVYIFGSALSWAWIFNFFFDMSTLIYNRHLSKYRTPLPSKTYSFCGISHISKLLLHHSSCLK